MKKCVFAGNEIDDNKYFLSVILICIVGVFSYEMIGQSNKTLIEVVIAFVLAFGAYVCEISERYVKNIRTLTIVLLVIGAVIVIWPINYSNPLSSLNMESLACLLIFCVSWVFGSVILDSLTYKNVDNLLFYVPLLFLVLVNLYFVVLDYCDIQPTDHARHLGNSFLIYDLLVSDKSGKLFDAFVYYDFYQPLVYLVSFPFLLFFGKTYTSACMSLILFWLPFGYFFVWKTCRECLKMTTGQSSLSVLVVFGAFLPSSLLKQFLQDFPLLAVAAACQYYLLASDFFRHKSYSTLAGVFFGIGLLCKANFLLFGIGIGLTPFFLSIIRRNFESVVLNLISYFIIGLGIFFTWFAINGSHYNYNLADMKNFAGVHNLPEIDTWSSFFWYWRWLPVVFGWPLMVLFSPGVFRAFYRRDSIHCLHSAVTLFFVVIVASFVRNKDVRTILPLAVIVIPFLASMFGIRNYNLRIALVMSILFWCIAVNFYNATGFSTFLPRFLLTDNYSMISRPLPPNDLSPIKAKYIYDKLYTENFNDNPNFYINDESTIFTDRMYQSQYSPEVKINERVSSNGKVVAFYKDTTWQNYYLFSFERDEDTVKFIPRGSEVGMGGDFFIHFIVLDSLNSILVDKQIPVDIEKGGAKISTPKGSSYIIYSFFTHHSHPDAQKEAIIYKLQRMPYNNFNIPLYRIRSGGVRRLVDTIRISEFRLR